MASNTVPAVDGCALSVGQEALWFLQQLAPDSSAYNINLALRLDFDVDVTELESAVHAVVSGNSMLNCLFRSTRAGLRRLPKAAAPYLSVFEVRHIEGSDEAGALHAAAIEASQRPFQLDCEAPVRVSLLRAETGKSVLVVSAHHIAQDNLSMLSLLHDLLAAYGSRVAGPLPQVRPRAVDQELGATPSRNTSKMDSGETDTGARYLDFVQREQKFLRSPRGESARRYWQSVLQAVPSDPPLVGDLTRPDVYRFEGDEIETLLPHSLRDQISALCARADTTPFVLMFAVFQLLLYSLSGARLRLVGYPADIRPGVRERSAIGYYVNTLPFPARVEADDSFADLLQRTKTELWSGLAQRKYPFALMPSLVDQPREANRAGLINVLCVANEEDTTELARRALPPGHHAHAYQLPHGQGQFDLVLTVSRRGPETALVLQYNTSLFTAGAAETLTDAYLGLLTAATEDALPGRLGDLASTLTLRSNPDSSPSDRQAMHPAAVAARGVDEL